MTGANLERFLMAQDQGHPSQLEQARSELRSGRKVSHWIWFVLPQLRDLGRSELARRYGIADLEEARAYLADPLLRGRLEDVIAVIADQLRQPGQSLRLLMGGELDAAKTISCLTLYEAAGLQSATALLDEIGHRCRRTRALLNPQLASSTGGSSATTCRTPSSSR